MAEPVDSLSGACILSFSNSGGSSSRIFLAIACLLCTARKTRAARGRDVGGYLKGEIKSVIELAITLPVPGQLLKKNRFSR
ncbi:uncharacterized protein BDV14DRAFT_179805 [Aspergillus stella-maris]|uniref:uncharacterized protein n=1 Tax=Aspergillus stella-maris TaxID=1810926 RepID=UPI003CCCFDA2